MSQDRMALLIQKLPRWQTTAGDLVSPNDVLRVAADILEAVSSALSEKGPGREDARNVLGQSIVLLRAVSETSVATPVSKAHLA